MPIKFSQFFSGGAPETGDIVVGLENQQNTQFDFSNEAGTGTAIVNIITQPMHGFVVGNVVFFNGVNYVLAKADTASDAEVIGIVSVVIDVNTFSLLTSGYITTLTALTAGSVYFLSDTTAGLLQTTEPTTPGYISKPLLIATSTTAGFFFNWRGKIIPLSTFPWAVVSTDTVMVANMGYIIAGSGTIHMTLPAAIAVGGMVRIAGTNVAQWQIVQGSGQSIIVGNFTSTVGATGHVASSQESDCIELLCINPNSGFVALSTMGNLIIS